jgi:hypothetical protein
MKLIASLRTDRTLLGQISAFDDEGVSTAGPFPCLALSDEAYATAHGNPERDPLKTGGNTPTGTYRVSLGRVPVAEHTLHSYGEEWPAGSGSIPVIELVALSGAALASGRSGLWVHSGVLNPAYTQWGGLRPTFGCLRTHEADKRALIAQIEAAPSAWTLEVDETA